MDLGISTFPYFCMMTCGVGKLRFVVWPHMTYSKSMDQPGKVDNPARGQLNRENEYFSVRVHA